MDDNTAMKVAIGIVVWMMALITALVVVGVYVWLT